MIKKRKNTAQWLIFVGFLSLQAGCASLQMDSQSADAPQPSAKTGKNSTTKPEKSTSVKLKQVDPKKNTPEKSKLTDTAAIKVKPESELSAEVFYYLLSAEIAAQRGQIGLSAILYTNAAKLTHDPRIAQQATRAAFYARDNKRAIAAANLWHKLEPQNIEARQVLAALLVSQGKTAAAAEHFEYVLSHGKYSERQGFMLITSLLSKEKDKQTALAVMETLIAKRKNNPNALYAYSQLAFLVGDLDKALLAINNVIKSEPEWTEAYILQSNIFVRQGDKSRSIEMLKTSVEEHPSNAKLRMFYARNLVDAKQFDEAAKQFDLLTDDEQLQHEARYALGLLSLQMNKPNEAEEYFSQLLEDKKRIVESQYYLAQSYELQNNLKNALVEYKKVLNNKYSFESELRIALILAKQGELQEALQSLQNMSPDSQEKELRVYLTEGEILNNAKLYEEAVELYTVALQQLTENDRLLYARALTSEKIGKINDAVKDLEGIVKRKPENAQALNALGYTLIDKTDQLERGLGYIKHALKLEPNDPAIHDSMGWAYYRLGQYDKAIKYLRRAFDKLKDAEVAAHLGEVLWVAGEREAAKEIWNAALEQMPNDNLLLNVIQKFSE